MIQQLDGVDLADRLQEISGRIRARADKVTTEEATKTAMVMPFIAHILGYNVFDPSEVIPEYTADVGTKKGEKVDYAIFQDEQPILLFECKQFGAPLDRDQISQLYRYFSVTDVRFGVLTDGGVYQFYSDIEEQNRMDMHPFLEFNLLDPDTVDVVELKRFTKTQFDADTILANARDLKFTREVLRLLHTEWQDPSEDFVRLLASRVYDGVKTKRVMEQFTRATKKAQRQFVAGQVNERLKVALSSADTEDEDTQPEESDTEDSTGIITTEEEWQAYYAVSAILSDAVDPQRVTIKDYLNHCNILLDNNRKQPICRLYFNSTQKKVGLIDDGRELEKVPLNAIGDLFDFADHLRETVYRYLESVADQPTGGTPEVSSVPM